MSKDRETPPASAVRPTIGDVARRAAVSVPAVSQALSWPEKPGTLSAATRERILRVVAELGYQRSRRAQLFAQGTTRSIALLYEGAEPSDDLLTVAIVAAAAAALAEHDYQLVASPFLAAEARWEAFRRDPGVDGALLVHCGTPRLRALITGLGLAAVEVGAAEGLPARVAADAGAGMAALIGHLAGLGHRRVRCIAGGAPREAEVAAFLAAMDAAGLGAGASVALAPPDAAVDALVQEDGPRPTALIAADHRTALALLGELAGRGIAVPRQLSVVAHGDAWPLAHWAPAVTAYALPTATLGRTAVELLLERLAGRASPPLLLPGSLVVRASTARPGERISR